MHIRQSVVVLACVVGGLLTFPSDSGSTSALQTPERRVIEVIVKRYEFVPPSIEVTQGERVRLVVKSGDGLHGFGIKKFNVSKEIARGATINIDFTPDAVGEFPILCTEFCGDGHEEMKGVLIVKAVQP
jgi:cytochrome c oxidase subunit 2